MATFTIELRKIVDELGIDIGLDTYPIWKEDYRLGLNRKIIDHYKFHEIAFETVEMFVDRLNHRMNYIMPTYNELYRTTEMKFDPFITERFMREEKRNTHGTDMQKTEGEREGLETNESSSISDSTSSTDSDSKSRAVNSDFPQTMLSETGDYASSAADSVSESKGSGSGHEEVEGTTDTRSKSNESVDSLGESEQDETGLITGEGQYGNASALLMAYRDTILNVDAMVIAELKPLFFGLWDIGDEYGHYPRFGLPYNLYFGGF